MDRIGLKAWRDRRRRQATHASASPHAPPDASPNGRSSSSARPAGAGGRPPPCLVHIIERSSPFSGVDDAAATGESDVHVVRSPKSGVNFFDLGDFDHQFDAARRRARPMLEQLLVAAAPGSNGCANGFAPPQAVGGGAAGTNGVNSVNGVNCRGSYTGASMPPPLPLGQQVCGNGRGSGVVLAQSPGGFVSSTGGSGSSGSNSIVC